MYILYIYICLQKLPGLDPYILRHTRISIYFWWEESCDSKVDICQTWSNGEGSHKPGALLAVFVNTPCQIHGVLTVYLAIHEWFIFLVNVGVGKYTIHGFYGYYLLFVMNERNLEEVPLFG